MHRVSYIYLINHTYSSFASYWKVNTKWSYRGWIQAFRKGRQLLFHQGRPSCNLVLRHKWGKDWIVRMTNVCTKRYSMGNVDFKRITRCEIKGSKLRFIEAIIVIRAYCCRNVGFVLHETKSIYIPSRSVVPHTRELPDNIFRFVCVHTNFSILE